MFVVDLLISLGKYGIMDICGLVKELNRMPYESCASSPFTVFVMLRKYSMHFNIKSLPLNEYRNEMKKKMAERNEKNSWSHAMRIEYPSRSWYEQRISAFHRPSTSQVLKMDLRLFWAHRLSTLMALRIFHAFTSFHLHDSRRRWYFAPFQSSGENMRVSRTYERWFTISWLGSDF